MKLAQHPILARVLAVLVLGSLISLAWHAPVRAADVTNPASGSTGLQAKISSPPPTQGATIISPANGGTYTDIPITVSGSCPSGLLIKIFDNGIFMGSTMCANGSYSLSIGLFSGKNDLVARDYDKLDQAGPDSATVSVTFNDGSIGALGSGVSLTSTYARKGANPGEELSWPIIISGGTAPYAVTVDWGDGTTTDLISVSSAGSFIIKHTYKSAGQYKVVVKATDKNGTKAYLQLVGVADGQVSSSSTTGSSNGANTTITKLIWWPALLLFPMVVTAFWLGRRHQLYVLRQTMEKPRT